MLTDKTHYNKVKAGRVQTLACEIQRKGKDNTSKKHPVIVSSAKTRNTKRRVSIPVLLP